MADQATLHSFVQGVPRRHDLGYVLCANDEANAERIPHSVIMSWEEGQLQIAAKLPFLTAGVCVARTPLAQLVAVGETGDVFVGGSGDVHNESIGSPGRTPVELGLLRGVRAIEGIPYAVGMQRQVYRRQGRDAWVRLDTGPMPDPGENRGFEAIDGFDHHDLYAVGWRGEIWHSNGGGWQAVPSPTNLILTDVCCAADGQVYCCGQQGLVLRGRGDRWAVIDNREFPVDLWSLTHFDGSLYVAGFDFLLRLEDGELVPVDTGPDRAVTFGHLRQTDRLLWSTGCRDLMAFDGRDWTRVA